MTQPQETLQGRFNEQFKCIQADCDGNGAIPHQVAEGEWEAQQCQFHAEYLFPIKAFFRAELERIAKDVEGLKAGPHEHEPEYCGPNNDLCLEMRAVVDAYETGLSDAATLIRNNQ